MHFFLLWPQNRYQNSQHRSTEARVCGETTSPHSSSLVMHLFAQVHILGLCRASSDEETKAGKDPTVTYTAKYIRHHRLQVYGSRLHPTVCWLQTTEFVSESPLLTLIPPTVQRGLQQDCFTWENMNHLITASRDTWAAGSALKARRALRPLSQALFLALLLSSDSAITVFTTEAFQSELQCAKPCVSPARKPAWRQHLPHTRPSAESIA